jgi:uridine kinase
LVIGVAGGSGSGKTTVSRAILGRVGRDRIAYLQHDWYYHDLSHLPLEQRRHANLDHPESIDNQLCLQHLDQLIYGQAITAPTYDYATYTRLSDTFPIPSQPVILLEGILIFADVGLRERMDVKLFVDTEGDLRFIRRLQRDVRERQRTVEAVVDQYLRSVRPMHLEFVEPSKRYADVIIPSGGMNTIAIDMIVARIEGLLRERTTEVDD